MIFKFIPLYLWLLCTILLTSGAQRGEKRNTPPPHLIPGKPPVVLPPIIPPVNPPSTKTNPKDVIKEIRKGHPRTDVFATTSALKAEVKSGVVIQIFNNNTSFQDIKKAHEKYADESGIEFEFIIGDLNIESTVEKEKDGNLNVTLSVIPPETDNEAIIVNAEATVNKTGKVVNLTTSSVNTEEGMENVVVVINEPPTTTQAPISSTTSVAVSGFVATPQVLGGGSSNCQEVVTCQKVNIPRVGVKKVCSTKLVCK